MSEPQSVGKDVKDWTWVIDRLCPECGFEPAAVTSESLSGTLASTGERWVAVLKRPDIADRPEPAVWSPLEYAAHVRDVYRTFEERARLMLTVDDPKFPNWDQDETALESRYWESDPAELQHEIASASKLAADTFAHVNGSLWERKGFRSNGSEFTVWTLGVYFLHDVVHHLHDVNG